MEFFLDTVSQKFCTIYNTTNDEIQRNDKIKFRFECFKYNYIIKHIELPDIAKNKSWEAVLIEYRIFPHTNFLIRNAILKLGVKWSYTVVCGNLNYEFMKNMCLKISKNIKVIKTNFDNLIPNDYNTFLSSIQFWNLLYGKKILIYQEDSFIFKNNIEDFIEYDYIGAPWPKNTNDTPNCVGNGGISLRTKEVMIDVINKISIKDTVVNKSTKIYMKNSNLTVCPEDVYFSLNMQQFKIGSVADFDTAFKFSSESINNPNSFAGHNFWLSDKNWLKRVKKNMNMYNYTENNNLDEFLYFMKKPLTLNLTKQKNNAFDIDFFLYKKCNNIFIKDNKELSQHFYNYGMNGLIYNVRQLYNLYPNIKIFYFYNDVFVFKKTIHKLNYFINEYVYSKSFDSFMNLTISNFYDNLSKKYSSLILLAFIGNIEVGNNLLEKIILYKNIENFNISFCFNSKTTYNYFKSLINDNFKHFAIYFTKEYGTDIQPTIFMYNDICKTHNFEYIIKLHTKSIKNDYNDLTNYLLSNNLSTLKNKINKKKCNCVGEYNYYMSLKDDPFVKKNINKYLNFLNTNKYFVKGTIFFTEHETFIKVIQFIKNNDYKSYIFNNLYENNSINYDFSPTHFLERLFGIIN